MNEQILELKRLNAAYIAALEFDYCPGPEKTKKFMSLFDAGISKEDVVLALSDEQGRRPDEIAQSMSELIKNLEP